ncbi:EthD family reductase [Actinomycetospora termitidis]|uniref:EthD family reductase n=1 Tax=Actinomycetospora termitidis TaxID=3053470 RepID=A0ABT7MD92_9PSEU|nr:EthD family reductase [Actinomycetospora sp. Odt1-22]MDL5158632.1 EthD family reductase [Actinomycetospora sp. Odt1-22]
MYRLTASYHHPADRDAFVTHYRDVHAKLAAKLPDVRSFSWGVCETPDGSQPPHALVAVLDWDSKEAAQASLGSEEGQAAVADLDNFAQAGVDMEFQELTSEV